MILVKTFKFFPQSILFQNCFDVRFDCGLGKKISLFRVQKCHFKIRENLQFSEGLTHDFCQKCKISSAFVSLSKGPCSLYGLQNDTLKIVEKFAFSHGERFPRFWSKT